MKPHTDITLENAVTGGIKKKLGEAAQLAGKIQVVSLLKQWLHLMALTILKIILSSQRNEKMSNL